MRNRDVAQAFADGLEGDFRTAHLSTDRRNRELKSYATVIAERTATDRVYVNPTKYSMTTSHHQSALCGALGLAGYEQVGRDQHGWERWERTR